MNHCSYMESSTGWLCYDPGTDDWFIGFERPRDGLGGKWKPELQPLIDQVLQDARRAGVDIDGTIKARRAEHARELAMRKPIVRTDPPQVHFGFWFSEDRGIIRERRAPGKAWHPEVWNGQRWVTGSAYVLDAITGMGEDAWSSGEAADRWDQKQAEEYAAAHGIDLYADNPDAPHRTPGGAVQDQDADHG